MSSENFSFAVDLIIRGFTCSPANLSTTFGVQPEFAIEKGRQLGSVLQKRSIWAAYLHGGSTDEEFGTALNLFLKLLEQQNELVRELNKTDAEILCLIRGGVAEDDGIVFQLNLDPDFVRRCGLLNIGLQIEGWTPENRFSKEAQS